MIAQIQPDTMASLDELFRAMSIANNPPPLFVDRTFQRKTRGHNNHARTQCHEKAKAGRRANVRRMQSLRQPKKARRRQRLLNSLPF